MDSGVWAFYFVQGEDGEERSHPNAFRIGDSSEVTFADVQRAFPLGNASQFHFRFRLNHTTKAGQKTFFWLDVSDPSTRIPMVNGRVICKLLRLRRPVKRGLVFRRKPMQPSYKPQSPASYQAPSPKRRETPAEPTYSDKRPPYRAPSPKRREASAEPAYSEKRPAAKEAKSKPPQASPAQDFLSGGSNIDLMNDAPPQTKKKAPVKQAYKESPKFDDETNQTVGPVTMAEMQAYQGTSYDGSNVYDASKVDKATKSEDVRRAMEEREQRIQQGMAKARDELRQREESAKTLSAQKESAGTVLGPKLKAWAEDNGRVKNIRTLLSTMHNVMWEGSKWTEVNMGKLLQPNDVKKYYRKAMIVVHPDKSSGRSAEQLLIAERVFAAVNTAWDEFQKTGK